MPYHVADKHRRYKEQQVSEEQGVVAVAGATGRTGKLCVEKLVATGARVRALVRSQEKAADLPADVEVVVADILDRQAVRQALDGVSALIIATSAQPRMREGGRGPMDMYYPEDGTPEKVDYHGQVNLIDAAKEAGVQKVVLISSLGITNPDNILNKIGNDRPPWPSRRTEPPASDARRWHRRYPPRRGFSRPTRRCLHRGVALAGGAQEDVRADLGRGSSDDRLRRPLRAGVAATVRRWARCKVNTAVQA
jgi:hypothetical protein